MLVSLAASVLFSCLGSTSSVCHRSARFELVRITLQIENITFTLCFKTDSAQFFWKNICFNCVNYLVLFDSVDLNETQNGQYARLFLTKLLSASQLDLD